MTAERYIRQYAQEFMKLDRKFWNYEDGCVLAGLEAMYKATGRKCYAEAVKVFLDRYICPDGRIRWYDREEYSLDKIPSGRGLLFLYRETGQEKYRLAAKQLMEQLRRQPRTESGSFWHKKIYPRQIWLDGLYMAAPFYLQYEMELGDKKNCADIIKQFENARRFLYDESASLYIHAYDEGKCQFWADPETGRSPNFWSRAEGWYLMALADCCSILPRGSEDWQYLAGLWKEAMEGMLRYQDQESGLFFQLTALGKTPGNYLETSASAMAAYSIYKGYEMGIFNRQTVQRADLIMMALETEKLKLRNGCLHLEGTCAGAGLGPADRPERDGSVSYYLGEAVVSDEQKGAAAFMLAYSQWEVRRRSIQDTEVTGMVKLNDVYELRHRAVEEIELGYGTGTEKVKIPGDAIAHILTPHKKEMGAPEEEIIERALDSPIGTERLEKMASGKKDVVIITSDITRPMPSWRVLPHVLKRLEKAGVSRSHITVVFAMGTHRRHTSEEMRHLAGDEVYNTCRCMDSSECSFIHMGETKAGTPVDIADKVAHADLRICLGNIEYHFFAGYSGGAKAIMPGVSTMQAIRKNHSRMIHPMAKAGTLEGNPVREDLEEAAGICGVDFLLNVVLDEHKNVIHAVAGELKEAHRQGCRFLDGFYRMEINELADIVIVSQGGAPKDLNLYQTQKALANAEQAVRQGGIIILAGACPEGLGGTVFEQWMLEAEDLDSILKRIQRDFQIGGHKAASFARALKRARIFLVSGIDRNLVRDIFMEPFDHVQEAYDAAVKEMGPGARVIVMPYGGSTLPVLSGDGNTETDGRKD